MGYVERHLLPNERVLYKTRLHWILFFRSAALTVAGVVLAVLLSRVDQLPWLWWVGAVVAAVGVSWGLVHYVELMTSEFAVTSSRGPSWFASPSPTSAAPISTSGGGMRRSPCRPTAGSSATR